MIVIGKDAHFISSESNSGREIYHIEIDKIQYHIIYVQYRS